MIPSQVRIFKVASQTQLSKFYGYSFSRYLSSSSSRENVRRPFRDGEDDSLEFDRSITFDDNDGRRRFDDDLGRRGNGRRPIRDREDDNLEFDKRSNTFNDSDRRRSFDDSLGRPPKPLPNRPLRGDRMTTGQPDNEREHFQRSGERFPRGGKFSGDNNSKFGGENIADEGRVRKPLYQSGSLDFLRKDKPLKEDQMDRSDEEFLGKFKLGGDKKENKISESIQVMKEGGTTEVEDGVDVKGKETIAQDADEIFKKMKETGLVPNAVAMLDGLCKDGLVHEALKLFGLMREKGTFPGVVIYTAVVEGFCKAHKADDAKRIFRKMQANGIAPNAFSYGVLVQGLYTCNHLDDAVEFAEEMLEAGHSPNLATFVGLLDIFSKERSVDEARNIINRLRQKGFFLDEKAVREFLDKKKEPSSPLVWEAIFGKKSTERLF